MSADPPAPDRLLVAVFASPVSAFLLRYGADLGFRTLLVEPDATRVPPDQAAVAGFADLDAELAGGSADVVVTDHHRDELGELLRDALARPGPLGRRHGQPAARGSAHRRADRARGARRGDRPRAPADRPGHRLQAPAEIAVSTLAGLLADRNGRTGGFAHAR